MGGPGSRSVGQDLAPFYILKVEGTKLEVDITSFVKGVEFESAVDMLDLLKIDITNPGFVFDLGGPDFTAHKVFQPGNQVDVWAGYGAESEANFLGRAIIDKHMPNYPENALPSLVINGYDAAKRMTQEQTEITTGDRSKRKDPNKDQIGKKYPMMTHSQMVEDKAAKYGWAANVYPTTKIDTLFQKKGMNDYNFVRGLAAINAFDFWVDYDVVKKNWTLNWLPRDYKQRPTYVLDYGTNSGAIFRCDAEYGLSDQITDLQVMYFSEENQQWQRVDKIVKQPGADPRYRAGATPGTTQTPRRQTRKGRKPVKVAKRQRDLINEEITNVERLRLASGGHSIDVIPMRRFKDAADAVEFSKRWIQKRREHFIILKGETVGIETMRARQIHEIKGLGKRLSGKYYFTSVRHKLGGGAQYRCEFQAHKVLEDD
jgi:phage protein D